jgi:DNA-binding response OmpR family regulator
MPDILVIDDNPMQLSVRAAVLERAGFSVQNANSAEEAMDLLGGVDAESLRLIVTDHMLPGASGAAFVRELRSFKPDVPVLVITGMDEAEPEYSGLGVVFLHKPCAPEELIARVRKALGAGAAQSH